MITQIIVDNIFKNDANSYIIIELATPIKLTTPIGASATATFSKN